METYTCKGCEVEINPDTAALSRYDHGLLCSECGVLEALYGDFIGAIDYLER